MRPSSQADTRRTMLTTQTSRSSLCFAAATAFFLQSCAHYGGVGLERYKSPEGFTQQREVEGLYLEAHDLSVGRDSERYFDRELVDYGFVPVMVSVERDQNTSALFDINRHDMRLVLNDATRLESVDPAELADDVAFSYWRSAFGFLFVVPGFFVVSSVTSANHDLAHDYKQKAFDSVRLDPNTDSFRGVVFFKIPSDVHGDFNTEDAFVEVKVYKRAGENDLGRLFDIPVHLPR